MRASVCLHIEHTQERHHPACDARRISWFGIKKDDKEFMRTDSLCAQKSVRRAAQAEHTTMYAR